MGMALRTKLNIHHAVIQGVYFAGFAALWGFGPVLLLHQGLSNSALGVVTSLSLLAPLAAQPYLASLADRRSRVSSRSLALGLGLAALLIGAVMWRCVGVSAVITLCYALGGTVLVTLSPFLNSMVMAYYLRGVDVNYGLGRGVGSASYAAVALVLGFLLERREPTMIVPVYGIAMAGLLVCIYCFRYPLPAASQTRQAGQVCGVVSLLRRYPAFALLLLGCALLQGAHNATNTYMIHIVEKTGAGEGLMGVIMAISAFVELPAMALFPRLRRRFSLRILFRVCAGAFCVRMTLFLLASAPWMLYLAAVTQFFEFGIFLPSTVYYVAEHLDEANQVKGQGLIHVFSNGAGPALITFISGQVLDRLGLGSSLTLHLICAGLGLAVVIAATSRRFDRRCAER